jgi:mannose-6-phosphate isomerase-like protein (cupin superfamily)
MEKTKLLNPKIYPKGWGEEVWIINCSDYCMKFLHFKAGSKGSMHFHVSKHETWYIQKGKLRVNTINTDTAETLEIILTEGDVVDIPKLNPHQVHALEDTTIIEVSTQHFEDDSYRVLPGDSQMKA